MLTLKTTNDRIDSLENRLQKLEDEVFAPSAVSKVGKALVSFVVNQKDTIKNLFKTKKTKTKEGLKDIKKGLENLDDDFDTAELAS